jgi:hypothetical protein
MFKHFLSSLLIIACSFVTAQCPPQYTLPSASSGSVLYPAGSFNPAEWVVPPFSIGPQQGLFPPLPPLLNYPVQITSSDQRLGFQVAVDVWPIQPYNPLSGPVYIMLAVWPAIETPIPFSTPLGLWEGPLPLWEWEINPNVPGPSCGLTTSWICQGGFPGFPCTSTIFQAYTYFEWPSPGAFSFLHGTSWKFQAVIMIPGPSDYLLYITYPEQVLIP